MTAAEQFRSKLTKSFQNVARIALFVCINSLVQYSWNSLHHHFYWFHEQFSLLSAKLWMWMVQKTTMDQGKSSKCTRRKILTVNKEFNPQTTSYKKQKSQRNLYCSKNTSTTKILIFLKSHVLGQKTIKLHWSYWC